MKLANLTQEEKTIYVGLLTIEQKDSLVGQLYAPDSYFNPIQDANDNWVISIEEIENNENPAFDWLLNLEMIIFVPKENTDLF
jgi:hypothetical protein